VAYPTLTLWHGEQVRLTGDPYVVHLVETAYIVECLLSATLDEADERCARARGRGAPDKPPRAFPAHQARAAGRALLADSHQPANSLVQLRDKRRQR